MHCLGQATPRRLFIIGRLRNVGFVSQVKAGYGVSNGHKESVITLEPGVECDIPIGTKFQFQADDGDIRLEIVITTTPPWPGDEEAIKCPGKWPPFL